MIENGGNNGEWKHAAKKALGIKRPKDGWPEEIEEEDGEPEPSGDDEDK